MRSWGEVGKDTVSGAARGAAWGGGGLALIAGGVTVLSGGTLGIPLLLGGALAGAKGGAAVGGLMGAAGKKDEIDNVAVNLLTMTALGGGGVSSSGDHSA